MFLKKALFILLLTFIAAGAGAQVRFYFQYRGIPLYKGGATDFSVLSGVKLDPNKELVVGVGLAGSFAPRSLKGDLKFDKNTFSLGFNYYWSRKFYTGVDIAFSQLKDIIKDNTFNQETLTGEFILDYQFNVTYIVFRRLHFSMATGLMDMTDLAVKTASDVVKKQKLVPDVALSLRLYVFQIRF
jgi:hypothetical protein